MFKKIISVIVCVILVASVCACNQNTPNSTLLNEGRTLGTPDATQASKSPAKFAARVFEASFNGEENTLISPISLIYALAMQMNGAKGETLKQMEAVLGASADELNEFCLKYATELPQGEKYKLNIANSVWIKDGGDFIVNGQFVDRVSEHFAADICSAPFDDGTVKDINSWADKNTDGLIKKMLDKLPEDAVLALMNATLFDAEWQNIYEKNDIRDGKFTAQDGTVQDIEMMYSEEYKYLEDECATGFVKYYADRKYAFVAMLPNEGVTVKEYAKVLADGENKIGELIENSKGVRVVAGIPKFETESELDLNDVLINMGMPDAFSEKADFTGIGEYRGTGNICISMVKQKTFIEVDERGTKAGAVTVIISAPTSAGPVETKRVILDRPFIYMIVDCENNMPVFMGAITNMK